MVDGSRLIFRGSAFALYAQVELLVEDDPAGGPRWETGAEKAVFSSGGVAVATMPDVDIDIAVYADTAPAGDVVTASGTILVGRRGLLVGNVVAATVYPVPWPAGPTRVDVCTNTVADRPSRVTFVLTALGGAPRGLRGAALRARAWVARSAGRSASQV